MSPRVTRLMVAVCLVVPALATMVGVAVLARPAAPEAPRYRSPFDVAYSPDGATLAVTDRTAASLVLVDPVGGKAVRRVALEGEPTGVVWSRDGAAVYVAECGNRTVAEVDPEAGRVLRRLSVGPRPIGVALASKKRLLLAANSGTGTVSVIDLAGGRERARIGGFCAPFALAVTPDESLAVVGNLLPRGPATDARNAAAVGLIDLETLKHVGDVRLPPGSTGLRGVVVSPDNRWVYAVHTVGRFTLPTTQLDRGWVNTNALTVIDLAKREPLATVLLDRLSEGAADPWGVAVSADGSTLWITLSGVHQIARIDLANLHDLLGGKLRDPTRVTEQARRDPSTMNTWLAIKRDHANRELLVNDLAALYVAGLIKRTPLPGKGPRGIDVSPDGKTLAVATYFTGHVALADAATGKVDRTVLLGPQPEPDMVRRGEADFHDATHAFQHWLSCATCHPDARTDGLNWDLPNDGLGNAKNARSLVWSHRTPPVMSRGVRASMDVAAAAGFRFIEFTEPPPGTIEAVRAYLRSLKPDESPYLHADGGLSPTAARGKAIFEGEKPQCAYCHPGPLYTNLKLYDVGTRGKLDRSGTFDTPTLVEMWRTAPYLHDGSAVTLRDVLTTANKDDKHGVTSHLSKDELDALVEYLLSL